MNKLVVLLLIVFFIFILPFNIIIYIFAPQSKFGKFMYQPCIKFLSHTIAYLIFITLLIISSVQFAVEQKNTIKLSQHLTENFFKNYSTYMSKNDLKYKFDFENIDFSIRRDSPSVIDITITIFIVGFFWQEVKHVFYYGIRDYLRSWNNMVNSLMNVLYISSFGLKYYTMYIASFNKKKVLEKEFWDKAVGLNGSSVDEQKKIYDTIYWLNNVLDRYYWVSFDPINMAEGLFAVANLFSFSKICFLLPANQQLGPLQISLGNMISDIVKFVTIFVIIFIAFSFAINNLYWYYQKPIREQSQVFVSNKSIEIKAEESFGTIGQTFLSMFWSLFGLGEQDSIKLSPYKNKLTEFFGTILFGCYHITSIIVLLNMLVASMTQSYEKILRESDIEWKFARSKLYMEYIKDGGTLPVPINIIPTPKSIFYMFKKLTVICLRKKENTKHERSNLSDQFQLDIRNNSFRKTSVNEELTYIKVMQRIVKRFLLHKQRESDEVGETDLEELKQDLQMSRYETLNDLKRIRDENYRLMGYLSQGILLIGEEIFKDHKSENAIRFRDLKNAELEYQEALDDFDKKENQIKSFNHRFKSDSIDSGLQSIRDLTTVMHSNCQIPSLDKKTKSMESLSSSDTLSENSNDQKIENIQLNESAKFEINVDVDSSDLASVDLQLNEESIDYQKIKNNNLHVINEEDEISTDSISRKE
ncbi:Short transient receptor potential channel 6 [Brachionus plicatilis]|uniref:Short transient receptor potential channel 6 n=1 Tax=Brachionus plicatilis TaxID=10195 RepID=A0A3M7PXF8_BRAPC|nr:Short transient receptor potential channel 6 [Brachionus plicatilis]